MLRPTANYKMSKPTKTMLASRRFNSETQRHDWKRSMIQAELAALIQPKREKGRRENKGE